MWRCGTWCSPRKCKHVCLKVCVAGQLREREGDQYKRVYSCHTTVLLCTRGSSECERPCASVPRAHVGLPWLQLDQYDKWLPFPQTSPRRLSEPPHPLQAPAHPRANIYKIYIHARQNKPPPPLTYNSNEKFKNEKSLSLWIVKLFGPWTR